MQETAKQEIPFYLRKARYEDAHEIAKVHTQSWFETYQGLICEEFLQSISVEQRQKAWAQRLLREGQLTLVAEDDSGQIIGFVNGGHPREEQGYLGEIYAIYLLKEYQGQKIGKSLFLSFQVEMEQRNINSFYLWLLRGNPTSSFYKHMGGTQGAEKQIQLGGKTYLEDLYGWSTNS